MILLSVERPRKQIGVHPDPVHERPALVSHEKGGVDLGPLLEGPRCVPAVPAEVGELQRLGLKRTGGVYGGEVDIRIPCGREEEGVWEGLEGRMRERGEGGRCGGGGCGRCGL